MSSILSNKYLVTFCRLAFAIIFLFAGIEKIANPEDFAVSISNYKILPLFSVNIFAILLPWIEIVGAILLIFNLFVEENSLLLNSLLVVFTVMVSIAVLRGLDIDCGCFGTKMGQRVGLLKISENLITIGIGYIVYKFNSNSIPLLKKH